MFSGVALAIMFCDFDNVGAHPLVRDALAEMSEAHSYVLAPNPPMRAQGSLPREINF